MTKLMEKYASFSWSTSKISIEAGRGAQILFSVPHRIGVVFYVGLERILEILNGSPVYFDTRMSPHTAQAGIISTRRGSGIKCSDFFRHGLSVGISTNSGCEHSLKALITTLDCLDTPNISKIGPKVIFSKNYRSKSLLHPRKHDFRGTSKCWTTF